MELNDIWKKELLKIFENKVVLELDDFTINTQKDYDGKEWIDIGKKKIWIKRCLCGKVRLFHYPSVYKKSKDLCRKCAMLKHNRSEKMRNAASKCKLGKKNHFYGLIGKKNPANKPDVRKKLIEYQNRPDIKEKHRITYVELMNKKRFPGGQFYNENACKFMDEWGKNNGYCFEHAINGKEYMVCGYWVDGYDKNKNVVFEYDETYHYLKKQGKILRPKDLQRMKKIQEKLKCNFIRYNEFTKEIKEYLYE